MCIAIHSDEDREISEDTVSNAVYCLREGNKYLPKHRNRWRKQIINEKVFLETFFPQCEVLKMDLSDISLELEKE